ncbi:hypothetical protein LP419_17070 [Massilia sp. H-1]|nr:hypothetical protein LP419_17070 [Massilia sp. H-1]
MDAVGPGQRGRFGPDPHSHAAARTGRSGHCLSSAESDLAPSERERQQSLGELVRRGSERAQRRMEQIARVADEARAFANMDFRFLYNPTTDLLAIGYNVSDRRLDAACY